MLVASYTPPPSAGFIELSSLHLNFRHSRVLSTSAAKLFYHSPPSFMPCLLTNLCWWTNHSFRPQDVLPISSLRSHPSRLTVQAGPLSPQMPLQKRDFRVRAAEQQLLCTFPPNPRRRAFPRPPFSRLAVCQLLIGWGLIHNGFLAPLGLFTSL